MDNKPYRHPSFFYIENKREELESQKQIKFGDDFLLLKQITKDYEEILEEGWIRR